MVCSKLLATHTTAICLSLTPSLSLSLFHTRSLLLAQRMWVIVKLFSAKFVCFFASLATKWISAFYMLCSLSLSLLLLSSSLSLSLAISLCLLLLCSAYAWFVLSHLCMNAFCSCGEELRRRRLEKMKRAGYRGVEERGGICNSVCKNCCQMFRSA